MLFFLFLLFIIILVLLIKYTEIEFNINQSYNSKTKEKRGQTYIKIKILKKFSIYKKMITKDMIKKINNSKNKKKINKILKQNSKPKNMLKHIKLTIEKLKLNLSLGTENALITALAVPSLTTIILMIMSKCIKRYDSNKYRLNIKPIYNTNIINIDIDCIINVKLVHIIYMLIKS